MRPLSFLLAVTLVLPLVPASARAQSAVDATVYVVSYIDVVFSAEGEAAGLLRRLRDASREDAGLVRFEVLHRTDPSNQFVLLEIWRDQQAFDAHAAAPPTKQLQEGLALHLLAPVDQRVCVSTTVDPKHAPSANTAGAVHVVTHVDVPGSVRPPALEALQALAARSRQEAGNLRFDVVHQTNRTNHFTVMEVWRDQVSYEAHELAAHTRAFRDVLTPITGALYDQRWYRGL